MLLRSYLGRRLSEYFAQIQSKTPVGTLSEPLNFTSLWGSWGYRRTLAEAYEKKDEIVLNAYKEAIEYANEIDLEVNAGHDLNLDNLPTLLSYGEIKEVSIGHALISEALVYGIENTVQKYIKITK